MIREAPVPAAAGSGAKSTAQPQPWRLRFGIGGCEGPCGCCTRSLVLPV